MGHSIAMFSGPSFPGDPVIVGVTMHILSISSVSEVQMVDAKPYHDNDTNTTNMLTNILLYKICGEYPFYVQYRYPKSNPAW